LWNKLNQYIASIGISIYILQIISYSLTVLINPGLPKPSLSLKYSTLKNVNMNNYRICNVCNVLMDIQEKTVHCEECGVCIEGYDHHCPWTTKCIGKNNKTVFYIFVCFTLFLTGFLFIGIGVSAYIN
jgi:hypothetical protein